MSFGKENDFGTTDICEIARRMCLLPKVNSNKSRVVVITQVSPAPCGKLIGPNAPITATHHVGESLADITLLNHNDA